MVLAVSACFGNAPAMAIPTAPQVARGAASFSQAGSALTVTNSNGAIINWNTFSIGAGESTRFIQPSSASSVLNRVLANDPSVILGSLASNGRVWLVNPAGILVGQGARIDVAAFIATTLNVRDEDFLAGRLNFLAAPNAGRVENRGAIATPSGGSVYLVAPNVENHGVITAPNGEVILAAGEKVELFDTGTPGIKVEIVGSEGAATNLGTIASEAGRIGMAGVLVKNSGNLNAGSVVRDGGRVFLKASKDATIDGGGRIAAGGIRGGSVEVSADMLYLMGELDAGGAAGGSVTLDTRRMLQSGSASAAGAAGAGGTVQLNVAERLIQTQDARLDAGGQTAGGTIRVDTGGRLFSSATLQATGAQGRGGAISMLGQDIVLLGAHLDASGETGGGTVLLGGDFQGSNAALRNAATTAVNFSTTLRADARGHGDGGRVVVWSDRKTDYYGDASARGGAQSGNGGAIEISGKETLVFGGMADAGAPNGTPGTLLLDPKNIIIDSAGGGSAYAIVNLVDPNIGAGDNFGGFGNTVVVLPNNNIVATDPNDDFAASNAGAVYLYNGSSGALISNLSGSTTNDQVGGGGITVLANGNYVVRSSNWNNASATAAGAVSWGSATAGVNGVVSASNSLVGTTANDNVGSGGITALSSNGNYVVRSALWDNGSALNAGAVTWGSGTAGVSGVVSATNSLVGILTNDLVGSSGITVLNNGNYVVSSPSWANGGSSQAGAVTWGSGTAGVSGVVSSANSLVGTFTNDMVGSGGITALINNGNYVVSSPSWRNGESSQAGAVTWGSGTAGVSGVVSSSNSLVGVAPNDQVGSGGITALSNGNYVVSSPLWNNVTITSDEGAVTWGSGTAGVSGVVSSENSLVGTSPNDQVGSGGITVLSNGNYVVRSPLWNNGAASQAGAVTWGSGTAGVSGVVSSTNSLVGTTASDQVGSGGITALVANGNYVVSSPNWDNGGVTNAGAATWGSGTTGVSGVVSPANSLVGAASSDLVGNGGITVLSNGNYVVSSSNWGEGASAATWGSGASGITGVVSASNSLVGTTSSDGEGLQVTALATGNYVVTRPLWQNGSAGSAGAVTWGSGTIGVIGVVSSSNSLVGTTANDQVGNGGITVLANGNYLVRSSNWNNGSATNAGAVTWGNGAGGTTGPVSAANSLVGSTASDSVGSSGESGGVIVLPDGNYVVASSDWDNGGATNAGAVTWGSGASGVSGVISVANSLVGTTTSDRVGNDAGINALSNGSFVVRSPQQDNGAVDSGKLVIYVPGGPLPGLQFGDNPSGNVTITPAQITAIANTGTALTLQANNDITLAASSDLIANNPVGNGGALTFQAGRSILLNSDISTDNGNFTAIAGDPGANSTFRDAGTPLLAFGSGASLNVGTGMATLAAIGGNFANNSGSASPITTAGAGRWLLYSSNPAGNTLGGISAGFKRYNCTYAGGCLTAGTSIPGSGNGLLYSVAPVLTVTPNVQTVTYGDTAYTSTLSGFIDGDTVGVASGSATMAVGGAASSSGKPIVGAHELTYAGGLTSPLGYQFQDAAGSTNELTVTARALSVTAAGANKVYDGLLSAAPTLSDNRVTGDALTLGGSASFLDKNVGIAKPVNVSGITLTGADAGNYTVNPTATLSADITVRPLSTWIGGASGLWSVAANWDALPDLSNVLAVSVPAGKSVTYDAQAGSTNLASLSAAGFSLAGGSLNIANSLTVSSSFSRSGGTLGFGSSATANITQTSGNLNLPALTLANLSLSAPAGAISQSGAIVASALITQSQLGTTLTDAGNRIASFSASNSGSGDVSLTNTGVLSIGSISTANGNITIDNTGATTTSGLVTATGGTLSLVSHSPLTIGSAGVSASGNIVLMAGATPGAGDDLTLSGPVSASGSAATIALSAGDDLAQNANVTSNGGNVTAIAQTGSISMALGATTATSGGSIGYAAPAGNITLTSLNAGPTGAIGLSAGGNLLTAAGFSGANLTGRSAIIAAGGNATLSTRVSLLDATVNGNFSVTDTITGSVLSDVPAVTAKASATETAATQTLVDQLASVIVTTTQKPVDEATQTPASTGVTTAIGSAGPLTLGATGQTTGGGAGQFGGSSADDDGGSGTKDDRKKDADKKDDGGSLKKDGAKEPAKKAATCA